MRAQERRTKRLEKRRQPYVRYDFARVLRLNGSKNEDAVEFGHIVAYIVERNWECSQHDTCVLSPLEKLRFEE